MYRDIVERHPNQAKFMLLSEMYFAERRTLFAQLRFLGHSVNGTLLEGDADVKRLRTSIKRKIASLSKRYPNYNFTDAEQECARLLLVYEAERFPNILAACRFYKGERSNPFENNTNNIALFWDYERRWVEFKHDREGQQYLLSELAGFVYYGLMSMDDRTPKSLQAILWNRYCHWTESSDVDVFERWYRQNYLDATTQQ